MISNKSKPIFTWWHSELWSKWHRGASECTETYKRTKLYSSREEFSISKPVFESELLMELFCD